MTKHCDSVSQGTQYKPISALSPLKTQKLCTGQDNNYVIYIDNSPHMEMTLEQAKELNEQPLKLYGYKDDEKISNFIKRAAMRYCEPLSD